MLPCSVVYYLRDQSRSTHQSVIRKRAARLLNMAQTSECGESKALKSFPNESRQSCAERRRVTSDSVAAVRRVKSDYWRHVTECQTCSVYASGLSVWLFCSTPAQINHIEVKDGRSSMFADLVNQLLSGLTERRPWRGHTPNTSCKKQKNRACSWLSAWLEACSQKSVTSLTRCKDSPFSTLSSRCSFFLFLTSDCVWWLPWATSYWVMNFKRHHNLRCPSLPKYSILKSDGSSLMRASLPHVCLCGVSW